MRRHANIAPAGKLTAEQIEAIRAAGAAQGSDYGVSQRQIQRVLSGRAWRSGWAPPRSPAEADRKICPVCRTIFGRRFQNGRLRSDRLWARKVACSNRCVQLMRWREIRAQRQGASTFP